MEIERADVGSKICKGNEVKFMNLEFFKGLRDEIEDGRIPDWLLVEVLTKLPAKLVFRSKLVSKQWLSLISEPYFRRTYIARASLVSQQSWTFISHIMHHEGSHYSHFPKFGLLEDISSQVLEPSYCVLPLPSTQPSHGVEDRFRIWRVSSGIVLYRLYVYSASTHSYYYICNPVTGQWIALPPFTCEDFLSESCGLLTHVEDGILKSYTVVRLDRPGRSNLVRFEVFFSEIGEWKSHNVSSEISLDLEKEAIALNGILHWMAVGHGIIAYDPHRNPEGIHVIALPSDLIHSHRHILTDLFVAHQGKLKYFEMSNMFISGDQFPSFKLWVLNDYGSEENWCLMHDISYMDVQHDTSLTFNIEVSTLVPISFHPFDSNLVYLGYGDFLVTYNIKIGKLEVQQKCSTGRTSGRMKVYWWCASLLAIPPWPISIPHSSFAGAFEG